MDINEEGIQITISATLEGDFTYSPSVKRVRVGQALIWTSTQGPFTISFLSQTPFAELDFHAERDGDGWSVRTGRILEDFAPGHFHYAVGIFVDGKVLMDASCPEIIVS
jgi:hypothetical protein